MACDLCGSNGNLVTAIIEGSQLNVCKACARFGKVVKPKYSKHAHRYKHAQKEEAVETLVPGFSGIIKAKRESLGLKQEDLAKEIAEKVSLVHKMESGHFRPSIALARKLERFLKIRIVETIRSFDDAEDKAKTASKASGLTIGDFIKIRK